jgi:hypothetical protein
MAISKDSRDFKAGGEDTGDMKLPGAACHGCMPGDCAFSPHVDHDDYGNKRASRRPVTESGMRSGCSAISSSNRY